jgi:hypothetical protein
MQELEGWAKIHRKIVQWEWYKDANTARLFLHLIFMCNHSEGRFMGQTIQPGERATSLSSLASELNIGVQSVRTSINKLKSTGEITVRKTNKFSIIQLNKWSDYQYGNTQPNNELTGEQQGTNRGLTTNKNVRMRECKNERILSSDSGVEEEEMTPHQIAKQFFEDTEKQQAIKEWMVTKGFTEEQAKSEMNKFIEYWTEPTHNGKSVRWEKEKVFDLKRRFARWIQNIKSKNISKPNQQWHLV